MRTDTFREFDRLVQQVSGTPTRPALMPMDAYRQGETFHMHFDLPGIDAESIDLSVEKNVLRIQAERKRPEGEGIETLVRERPAGTFSRRIHLGDSLDTDRLEANFADGVLSITLPVAEKAKPRRISINATTSATTAIDTESSARADELVSSAQN